MRTQRGVTIELNPDTRIPRTFKRFSGLVAQLLTQGKIQQASGGSTLLKASRLPVSALLPEGRTLVKVTKKGNLVPSLTDFLKQFESKQFVFVVPTMEDGGEGANLRPIGEYEEEIALSNYELSAISTCSKVCFAFEELWDIL